MPLGIDMRPPFVRAATIPRSAYTTPPATEAPACTIEDGTAKCDGALKNARDELVAASHGEAITYVQAGSFGLQNPRAGNISSSYGLCAAVVEGKQMRLACTRWRDGGRILVGPSEPF